MLSSAHLPTIPAGPALRLRQLGPADIDALYEVFSSPDVARYWSRPAMVSRDEAIALLAEIDQSRAERTLYQWGIARTADDRVIGTTTLFQLSATHRRAEIGYALGRAAWGQGHARAAVGALVGYAFEALDLHRLEADTDPRNARSIALLEKLGFVREGHLRERWHVAGEICDGLFFGLLAPAWRAARG